MVSFGNLVWKNSEITIHQSTCLSLTALRHGQTEQHCGATWTKRNCCLNVAQFGHCVGGQSHRKICCRNFSACSNIFWQHLSFSSLFLSLATMLGKISTQPSKWQKSTCAALKCAHCTVQTKWPLSTSGWCGHGSCFSRRRKS